MKTFIFAIGGTGARVLRAFTMLAATDLDIKSEIIPVVIDMDVQNGDTGRTLKQLDAYRKLAQVYQNNPPIKGLFKNSIGALSNIAVDGNGQQVTNNGSFQLSFPGINQTFNNYIKGFNLNKPDRDFLESLYNDAPATDPDTELNLTLNFGFKGNPNIGSIVFNDLINTPGFKKFQDDFSQGDSIFIISSIFGGTGSSGFPQLVENIRNTDNLEVQNAPVGALVVMPYFKVEKDPKSAINSDMFNVKTKSALDYYDKNLKGKINNTYYIADTPGKPIDNQMGGVAQKNDAHFTELLGAKAIIKFINGTPARLKFINGTPDPLNTPEYFEYGIFNKPQGQGLAKLQLTDFYNDNIWNALTRFALFCKFYKQGIPERRKDTFYKNLNLKNDLTNKPFYNVLNDFLTGFDNWLDEMERNNRAFNPFNRNVEFSKLINGMSVKGLDKKMFTNNLTELMNVACKNLSSVGNIQDEHKFILASHQAMSGAFNEYIKVLPTN